MPLDWRLSPMARYARALAEGWARIPADTLSRPHDIIPMPLPAARSLLLEPFIDPDRSFNLGYCTPAAVCQLL